jgi:hypothetical protein
MWKLDFILVALFTAGPLAPVIVAQVPTALDFPVGASAVAMGSAGAARWGEPGAVALNPALAATVAVPVAEVSFFEARRVDQQGFGGLVAFKGPLKAGFLVDLRQKGVNDLIDDPSVDERGLRVGDTAVGITVAYLLAGGRLAIGIGGRAAWSTVLATHGRAAFLDLGAAARPHPIVALGVALQRLGPRFHWSDPDGRAFSTGLATALRFGTALGPLASGPVSVTVATDLETGSSLGGTELGLGVELSVGEAARLRAGLARLAAAPPIWTAGLGLSFKTLGLDLAYESVEVVGPRLHFALRFGGRRRRAGSAGERRTDETVGRHTPGPVVGRGRSSPD